jgi:hypothetical protein
MWPAFSLEEKEKEDEEEEKEEEKEKKEHFSVILCQLLPCKENATEKVSPV